MKPRMMREIFEQFSLAEKSILCAAIRLNAKSYGTVHVGVLPFIPVSIAYACMAFEVTRSIPKSKRINQRILVKLEQYMDFKNSGVTTRTLSLKDALVRKRFKNSTNGVFVPVLPGTPVGLRNIATDTWQVSCPSSHVNRIELWLTDNCM